MYSSSFRSFHGFHNLYNFLDCASSYFLYSWYVFTLKSSALLPLVRYTFNCVPAWGFCNPVDLPRFWTLSPSNLFFRDLAVLDPGCVFFFWCWIKCCFLQEFQIKLFSLIYCLLNIFSYQSDFFPLPSASSDRCYNNAPL